MIGLYFSGTGNTKYCLSEFIKIYDSDIKMINIEKDYLVTEIGKHNEIIFAYPIYFSNLPKIVSDFIKKNHNLWRNKNIFIISTMGLFSGDGAGLAARLFKKYQANIIGGLHLKMPDCICDINLLKRKPEKNEKLIVDVRNRIELAVAQIKKGKAPKDGLSIISHISGLLGQRLWFSKKVKTYNNKVCIANNICIRCGNCVAFCPMKNFYLSENKIKTFNNCTLCYRCANQCPEKAITILGKKVISQYSIENFISGK